MAKVQKVQVTVIKETAKAKLVEFDGVQVWMMNRSVDSNNMVNQATLEKEIAEKKQSEKMKSALIKAPTPNKETDAAVCFKMNVTCTHTGDKKIDWMWVPKSMIKFASIPVWFFDKKIREIEDKFTREVCVDFAV